MTPHPRSAPRDRKSTRLNSSHQIISYAVFCLKKKIRLRRSSLYALSYVGERSERPSAGTASNLVNVTPDRTQRDKELSVMSHISQLHDQLTAAACDQVSVHARLRFVRGVAL